MRWPREADWLHVDVMDGHFVPNLTIGPPVVESLRRHSGLFFDCHLMMTNPGDYLEAFAKAGADGCTVHVEVGDTAALLDQTQRARACGPGWRVNPETPFEAVEPFLAEADLVLCMTVFPGSAARVHGRGPAQDRRSARRAGPAWARRPSSRSTAASTSETAPLAVRAGARVLVAGSAVFGHDRPWEAARRIRVAGEQSPA